MAPGTQQWSTAISEMSADNGIKVCCRFRPINKVEASERSVNAVTLTDTTVNVQVGAASNHDFAFDRVFQPGALAYILLLWVWVMRFCGSFRWLLCVCLCVYVCVCECVCMRARVRARSMRERHTTPDCTQEDVFEQAARPLVDEIFAGLLLSRFFDFLISCDALVGFH